MSGGASDNYAKWNFKVRISSIFRFEHVNEVWISGILCVKALSEIIYYLTHYLPVKSILVWNENKVSPKTSAAVIPIAIKTQ